jgi:prevent-host-death family protein
MPHIGDVLETVNIHEAKTHFSRLVERAEHGEEIIIARSGRPVARLVPLEDVEKPRVFGRMRGKIRIADDFDAPLPDDILDQFENSPLVAEP